MEEVIVKIIKPTRKGKKYTAIIRNKKTKKERKISFGAINYPQFKDSTPLKLYTSKNHGDPKRRKNYFTRHSGVGTKAKALKKEIENSNGLYNAKILSHKFLW